jgi:hypothetical protein
MKKVSDEDKRSLIREWEDFIPQGQRQAIMVIKFLGYLEKERPELLSLIPPGDKYTGLKSILHHHIDPDLK